MTFLVQGVIFCRYPVYKIIQIWTWTVKTKTAKKKVKQVKNVSKNIYKIKREIKNHKINKFSTNGNKSK